MSFVTSFTDFFRCSSRQQMKILYTFIQSMERQQPKLNNLSKFNAEATELKEAKRPTENELN